MQTSEILVQEFLIVYQPVLRDDIEAIMEYYIYRLPTFVKKFEKQTSEILVQEFLIVYQPVLRDDIESVNLLIHVPSNFANYSCHGDSYPTQAGQVKNLKYQGVNRSHL
ncbi:hypothetical protein LIER_17940 [Lithospermum erythrorhizon]|uniref:Uncharacterized protein n=1 Tax=Lithospermum erythrorhizon TaxID=34254 RepID=A0AAV3QCD7_LITER